MDVVDAVGDSVFEIDGEIDGVSLTDAVTEVEVEGESHLVIAALRPTGPPEL